MIARTIPRNTAAAWRAAAIAALVAAAALPGCAPHRPPETALPTEALRARYTRAEAGRARNQRVDLRGVLRLERAEGSLPGVEAQLMLRHPDSLRCRISSAFGTAVDAALHGDSFTAYFPSQRAAVKLGSEEPGARRTHASWAVVALSAVWSPPAASWESAHWIDDARRLEWSDGEADVALEVDGEGLPRFVEVCAEDGTTIEVRYRGWQAAEDLSWPSWVEVELPERGLSLVWKVHRIRFPEEGAFQVRTIVPARVAWMSAERARELLRRLAGEP